VRALSRRAEDVSACLQLAILLEVSAYPKPGNVHRTRDFEDTQYEHFLASAAAIASPLREAARRGALVSRGSISVGEVKVGSIIKQAVQRMNDWQSGGNTSLGSILLLSPIAVAAGMLDSEAPFSAIALRSSLRYLIKNTTPLDAVEVYDAISMAKPGGLGRVPNFDVANGRSKRAIIKRGVTLLDIFKASSKWDSVAYEWARTYPITFTLGYPYFIRQLDETCNFRTATVHTFLRILSQVPDTLIARRAGLAKSKAVSTRTARALKAGGLLTQRGRNLIEKLDLSLRRATHELNPGTTADLTASTLAVVLLGGRRP